MQQVLVARRRDQGKSGIARLLVALLALACRMNAPALERAHMLAEHGKDEEAISVLEAHLESHPEDVRERRQLIRLYGSVGRMDRASAQTERLAEILPKDSPIPWVELGYACELSHRYDEALAAYDRAAQLAPSDPLGPKSGGLRATRWGELGLAEPRLEEALRRDASDAEAWHALGLVRVGLGKLEAARQAYASGLRADPRALENHLGLATVALREHQPELALREYEALLAARPSFVNALLGKSWALILLGRWDAAEAALEQASARGADPQSIQRQRLAIRDRKSQPAGETPGGTPP
jgi:tetratricopeptide (TPR) repeat protein